MGVMGDGGVGATVGVGRGTRTRPPGAGLRTRDQIVSGSLSSPLPGTDISIVMGTASFLFITFKRNVAITLQTVM